MSDATSEFFDELDHRGSERLLRKTNGTIRFDLEHDHGIDHWLVTIINGDVQVSREKRDADCVIRTDNAFFDRMARGEEKPLPAWLRNEITSEGKFRFIVLLERLFPGSPGARHPRTFARERGGHR
ncbi:SCP2 sterol-binding domain-containing protein [Micromonospora sp. NBC_00389]|uniref:SCP2 sterol-binding domain-containing protein n=1 Tax=Micromonospora sp. NBC_00389 TaxID=2903586 RepID=UPI002E1B8253